MLQFFYKFRQLIGDRDGEHGNKDGVKEKREEAAVGEVGFDVVVYELLDDVIPCECGDKTEAGGGKRDHLFDDFLM